MKKYQSFLLDFFQFFEVIFSIYLNRRVFVMVSLMKISSVNRTKTQLRAAIF